MKPFQKKTLEQLHPDAEILVRGNSRFALDLYAPLKATPGNLFFSPYSISTALAMTYGGARGDTATQMAQTLHFTLSQKQLHPAFALLETRLRTIQEQRRVLLSVANSLWAHISYPLLDEFLTLTKEYYRASATPVDYGRSEAARQTINDWVVEKTQNKIKDLIAPGVLNPLTRLVLVNVIYFKGDWTQQFDKALTRDAPFWITPSTQVQALTMTQDETFRYGEDEHLQILELPYVGDDVAMVVLLPKQVDGLAQLETALTVENLEKWTSNLRMAQVEIFLPRFKTSRGFMLNNALASLGMPDAFDATTANFAGMDGKANWLYIGAAIHKAFVDVNEQGTEAAAATAMAMQALAMAPQSLVFRADHPFVFLIRENHTGSILFIGRVVNPLSDAG